MKKFLCPFLFVGVVSVVGDACALPVRTLGGAGVARAGSLGVASVNKDSADKIVMSHGVQSVGGGSATRFAIGKFQVADNIISGGSSSGGSSSGGSANTADLRRDIEDLQKSKQDVLNADDGFIVIDKRANISLDTDALKEFLETVEIATPKLP